jgi:hypothetical protein
MPALIFYAAVKAAGRFSGRRPGIAAAAIDVPSSRTVRVGRFLV